MICARGNRRQRFARFRLCLLTVGLTGVAIDNVEAAGHRPAIVCIDPGHPSEVSSGAVVQNGTSEVRVAWVIGQKLRDTLRAKGFQVVMTKGRQEQLVTNRKRAEIANAAGAALMVRLHCDTGKGQGFALYYPDQQGTKGGVTGPALDVINRSKTAAHRIHGGMVKALRGELNDGGVLGDSKTFIGARQGALTGSIFSKVPVVTIEMVVLSSPSDATFIKSARGQKLMVEAIASGVDQYLRLLPATETAAPAPPAGGNGG